MENDGIQRLLKAEDEAALVVQRARENRAARLRQAQAEADQSAAALKAQLAKEFKEELNKKDSGDSTFTAELKRNTDKEASAIDSGYKQNKQAVVDLLLHHITTVKLDVEEALRQSLLTKHETGQA